MCVLYIPKRTLWDPNAWAVRIVPMTSSATEPPSAMWPREASLYFDIKMFMKAPAMAIQGTMVETARESFHDRAKATIRGAGSGLEKCSFLLALIKSRTNETGKKRAKEAHDECDLF